MGLPEKVGIVGTAQSKYGLVLNKTIPEVAYEVVSKVLENAGLSIKDIENTVSASVDLWDGATASGAFLTEVVGGVMGSETRVADDGILAAFHAALNILSGNFDVVMVVAHCLGSRGAHYDITNWVFDPVYQQMLGLDYLSSAGLQANWYMNKYGLSEEHFAKVSVKNHRNAFNNPCAYQPMNISVDDVLQSEMLSYPIKSLEAAPVSDGACALILASEKRAKEIAREKGREPVWIKGMGNCYDSHYLGDRDLTECSALTTAAKKAYELADINEPLKEIDVAEISEPFSYQELLWLEGLGFCQRGGAGRLIDEGITEMSGELPVNPSGGMLAGNPYIVAGLTRLVEAVEQCWGEAGKRQVPEVETALAHGTTGPCGQMHCVIVVGR
ncbi:MAG: thiolase family protein [Candidatus Jordarchaeaceae archaeon]